MSKESVPLSETIEALSQRLEKVEGTLQKLQDAGLEKWLVLQAPLMDACHLNVPEHNSTEGVRPPEDPPQQLHAANEPPPRWSERSQASRVPVQSACDPVSPEPRSPLPEPLAEPKDALTRYHNRASVVQRRERGVDYQYLDAETKEYYTFGESTWDLVMLIGTGSLGPAGATQTVVLVVMNILMQGVFVGIAWFNFLEPDVDAQTIQDAYRWRRSSAHSLSEYDAVSKMSLAERVCSGDRSLHLSGVQMGLFDDIDKYLKPTRVGLESYFAGPVLCMVALICWYMMVGKEVSHALALHRGFLAIQRGENKIEPRENPFTQMTHFRLVSITNRRVVASYCLVIYRLLAAAVLIYVGTFFLVYTINVTELILNAVALEIILDIDDLIFDALATTTGRHLVHHLEPLCMPSLPRIRGADVKSMFMSCALPVISLFVYFMMVAPMVQDLEAVYSNLCGGNLAFTWSMDKRRVMLFAETPGGGWDDSAESLQLSAISEAITLDRRNAQLGLWESSVAKLTESESMSLEDLVERSNPNCEDLATSGPMLNLLRDGLGNQSIGSCADALVFCDSVSKMPEWEVDGGKGFLTRMLCSETCGCANPGGDFVNVQGCPYGRNSPCLTSSKFRTAVQSGSCEEKSAAQLRNFGPWSTWVQKLRVFGAVQSNGTIVGQAQALSLAEAMWDHGCGFGDNLTAQNITWGDCFEWNAALAWDFKTLEFFCPTTCGCDRSRVQTACPQPLGLTCDSIQTDCVLLDNSYICRDNVEILQGSLQVDVPDDLLGEFAEQAMQSLQTVLATLLGIPSVLVKLEMGMAPPQLPPGRRLRITAVAFEVFVTGAEPEQLLAILSSTSVETLTASFQTQLQELVPQTDASSARVQSVNVRGT